MDHEFRDGELRDAEFKLLHYGAYTASVLWNLSFWINNYEFTDSELRSFNSEFLESDRSNERKPSCWNLSSQFWILTLRILSSEMLGSDWFWMLGLWILNSEFWIDLSDSEFWIIGSRILCSEIWGYGFWDLHSELRFYSFKSLAFWIPHYDLTYSEFRGAQFCHLNDELWSRFWILSSGDAAWGIGDSACWILSCITSYGFGVLNSMTKLTTQKLRVPRLNTRNSVAPSKYDREQRSKFARELPDFKNCLSERPTF